MISVYLTKEKVVPNRNLLKARRGKYFFLIPLGPSDIDSVRV